MTKEHRKFNNDKNNTVNSKNEGWMTKQHRKFMKSRMDDKNNTGNLRNEIWITKTTPKMNDK